MTIQMFIKHAEAVAATASLRCNAADVLSVICQWLLMLCTVGIACAGMQIEVPDRRKPAPATAEAEYWKRKDRAAPAAKDGLNGSTSRSKDSNGRSTMGAK